MKRKLVIIGIIITSIGLTACSKNQVTPEEIEVKDENIDDKSQEIKNEDQVDKNVGKDETEGGDIIMSQDEMIEKSDYIAKVKMIQKGKDTLELKILDNVKGKLSKGDIPRTDLLKKNRAYLVFLKTGEKGIELTNGESSYIILEGDNNELFEKINRYR